MQIPELDYDALATDGLLPSLAAADAKQPSGREQATVAGIKNDEKGATPKRSSSLEKISGFRRSETVHGSVAGQRLFELLDATLRHEGFEPGNTVIHWHNHSLGKNAAAPFAISHLANAGWRLLLQIHDFAEDQRPENLQHLLAQTGASKSSTLDAVLYPSHANVSYACLTAGDADVLKQYGFAESRVTTIPNSVRLPSGDMPDREPALEKVAAAVSIPASSKWVLYPVRGIRRKNVGEFLLLCQLLPKPFIGGLTLKPDTTLEAESYERWRRVAEAYVPNVVFDAAHHDNIAYADNLSACHCVLSTSVAEGFGMAFLEPWLASRRVVARNLPTVTADFAAEGVRQPDLYDGVWIPGDAAWVKSMKQNWLSASEAAWALLPPELRPKQSVDSVLNTHDDKIDFACLMPSEQIATITRVANDDSFRAEVLRLNQSIIDSITETPPTDLIESNRQTIAERYSPDVQCELLTRSYQSLTAPREVDVEYRDAVTRSNDRRMIDLVARSHPFFPCRVETRPVATLANDSTPSM
ncbi:MAG: hypothetical protein ACF8CQ_11075 [Rhodopirellula sp. JB044]|uniref:hypothetical protein n=1 Tax=Rhodopirellula sp. JB044 TaxID=3342844 RepID=UPI00370C8762